jgi:chitinase
MEFLREGNIDGIDLYYPEPKSESIIAMIRELRLALEGEAKTSKATRLIITLTVPAAIPSFYNVEELSKYVDYFNVQTFDLSSAQSTVQHSSPLFAIEDNKEPSMSKTMEEWIEAGAPKEKLLIGVSTYGRTYKLQDETKFDIGSKVTRGGGRGRLTKEEGVLGYIEVCEFLDHENTTLVWDNEQMVPFAYRGDQWVGFDDERSLKTKIEWLKEKELGGIMVWTLDSDDYSGKSCSSGKYPLVKAIAAELKDYKVKLQYNGPHEDNSLAAAAKKKNANEIECAEEDGHISYHKDVNDCTKYFMCEGERKHHMPCPAQLVFNLNENVCDWPENVEECGALPK